MSVISLVAQPGSSSAAAHAVRTVALELHADPRIGRDGSWEFDFDEPYGTAHARVVAALERVDPAWTTSLLLDYALAV